jgi:hypothetical protein
LPKSDFLTVNIILALGGRAPRVRRSSRKQFFVARPKIAFLAFCRLPPSK